MTSKKTGQIEETRMPLTTEDVLGDRIEVLRELFPEVFADGKIDLQGLRLALWQQVDESRERYGLSWAGKAEAVRTIQVPSTGALVPVSTESVNFETSENIFIEGDNLEVLKLLQKSYYGKVKLIYIDPPYNTGNEFIYPDNFREGLQDYLRYSGQVDGDGIKLSTNTEADGRFHSKWLSMIWPRLFLARNLLRDDGFLCVSISDHECATLRFVLNEVFGEENFVAQFVWKSRQFPDDRTLTHVSVDHEYLLVYARRDGTAFLGVGRDESKFANPDEDSRGPWMSRSLLGLATKEQRPNLHYAIQDPATGHKYDPPAETGWRYGQEKMTRLIEDGCVLFPKKPEGRPREKKFRKDIASDFRSIPSIITDVHTSHGTKEIRELFGFQAFDFPKPTELIRTLVEQTTSDDDVILDFFAGSGTTGHAVYLQNARDGSRRRFICVQLPEPTSAGSEAEKRGFSTIAAIGKERLRLAVQTVGKGIAESLDLNHGGIADLGFKAFRLTSSNFKIWDGDAAPRDPAKLAEQIRLFADNIVHGRTQESVLYELILKAGLPLTAPIKSLEVKGAKVFSVADGLLLICLEDPIERDVLRGTIELKPQRVLCLDHAFRGKDEDKVNTVLEMRSHGIEFRTV